MNSVLKLRLVHFACLAVFAGVALFAGQGLAQAAADSAKIVAFLPADTHVVIDRLSSLSDLPDGAWKMHAGDLAHGEAVDLDESDGRPIAKGPGAQGCGVVSADLSGSGDAERL